MCKQKNNNHIILKDNDKIIRDQREVAETLNEFFSKNTSTEQTNVINVIAEILCCFFSTGFNFILDTSKIPQMWKKGEITPVHKKECTLTKGN